MSGNGIVTAHDLTSGEMTPFPTGVGDGFYASLALPMGGNVIAVGWLKNRITLWVLSAGSGETWRCRFVVIADGVTRPDGRGLHKYEYVGTAIPGPGGDRAFHVFENDEVPF